MFLDALVSAPAPATDLPRPHPRPWPSHLHRDPVLRLPPGRARRHEEGEPHPAPPELAGRRLGSWQRGTRRGELWVGHPLGLVQPGLLSALELARSHGGDAVLINVLDGVAAYRLLHAPPRGVLSRDELLGPLPPTVLLPEDCQVLGVAAFVTADGWPLAASRPGEP